MTKILAINSGSSSLKFQLFEMPEEKVITKGLVERIGIENSVFTIEFNGEKNNFFYEIENLDVDPVLVHRIESALGTDNIRKGKRRG